MDGSHGEIKWISTVKSSNNENIEPKYSFFGERIRHVAPSNLQCSMFCGGKQCKYCNPAKFAEDEMAINGLYSSWVTADILATSRPTTMAVKEYKIIEQFNKKGISSIINLQHSGEHGACGFGLDEESGFSYSPKEFMDNDVFFYNFGWNDYGVRSLHSILDMVKVMDFALKNGKVAIHCHAGLGRTGVLIACYLIYSQRFTSKQAILQVRNSRPKAIQTRGQITCVKEFDNFIQPMWIHFTEDGEKKVSFEEYMNNQRSLLHGEEARTLRYIPKISFIICQRLLALAEKELDLSVVARITRFNFMQNCSIKCKTQSSAHDQVNNNTMVPDNENEDHHDSGDDIEKEAVKDDIISEQGYISKEELFDDDINNDDVINNKTNFDSEDDVKDENNSDDDVIAPVTRKKKSALANNKMVPEDNLASSPRDSETLESKKLDPLEKATAVFDQPLENKRGGLVLEPITSRSSTKQKKGKSKKKRSRKKRSDSMENDNCYEGNSNDNNNKVKIRDKRTVNNECNDDNIEDDGDDCFDTNTQEESRFDNVSLASFSSTANEGLTPSDIVLKQLAYRCSSADVIKKIDRYKRKLNCSDLSWTELAEETDGAVLSGLFWAWLAFLQEPIISSDLIEQIAKTSDPNDVIKEIPREIWKLTQCLLTVLVKLRGNVDFYERALRRYATAMTGQPITDHFAIDNVTSSNTERTDVFYKFICNYAEVLAETKSS